MLEKNKKQSTEVQQHESFFYGKELFIYVILLFVAIVLGKFTDDFATPLLTFFAMIMIALMRDGKNIGKWIVSKYEKINENRKRWFWIIPISLIFIFGILKGGNLLREEIIEYDSKYYRIFSSVIDFPDNENVINADESSRQTVAGQIMLLNSIDGKFTPDFNTVILPSWKSVFFSDYGVLWSFKIGNCLFIVLYFCVIVAISYSLISLLIILNKPTAIGKYFLFSDSAFYCSKYINGNSTLFINNKYYGGCPPDAETVDFKLQEKLNRELEAWASEINKNAGFKMVAGSILVAKNTTGEIQASASFPLMYNENDYHVLHKKAELNNDLKKYKVGATDETVEIKFSKEANYINFAESDMMQGSIVKPLLAYYYLASGLPYSENDLNALLGYSNNQIAEKLFRNLFEKNDYFNKADSVYRNDFGFSVYNNGFEKDKAYVSHAIGQQQKLIFKDIVQAYIRIKEGKNVKLSYKKSNTSFENLSLNDVQLDILRNAMKVCLKNGTAKDIGKKTGTSNKEYLAKTGTAEIFRDKTKTQNRTSAFIVVTDQYTVGIQLYGVVQGNETGLHAKDLFIQIIEILKIHNIV